MIDGFDDELKVRDERIRVLERENVELKAKLQPWGLIPLRRGARGMPIYEDLCDKIRTSEVLHANNHAEQFLRHLVIFRKIYFGSRSESGLKTHGILPSLVQTARKQGVHPRKFLQTLLTADTATAQAALYNNSS